MSKGFIGLDNPSFQGNLRAYRRREVVIPQRSMVKPAGVLDDVSETRFVAVQNSVPTQKNSLPAQSTNQIQNKQQTPLRAPAGPIGPAGSEFVGQVPLRQEKRLSRSEKFEKWQRSQQVDEVVAHFNEREREYNLIESPQEPDVVSFEQFMAEENTADVVHEPKSTKSRFRFLRRVPFFGKLTRKDIFTMKFALPAMAVMIFLFGCGVAIQGVFTNRHVKAQVSEMSGGVTGYDPTGKDEVPDETKPDESAGPYIVAPNMPRYIRINKIGVMSRIIRVGVKPNNELIAPNNIHTVGWYEGSALPGEKGATLMDAHVHGPTMPGAFYKIHDLNPGDEIEVEMGDGRRFYYTVAAKESQPYQNVDMSKAMRSIEDGKNGLNLITCGGRYNRDIHMYEERIVVYAVQK